MKNKLVSLVDQLFKKPKKNKGENMTKFRPYPENLKGLKNHHGN